MEFLELAKDRFSVRSFSNRDIEADTISKIIEAAKYAPTGANRQPQKIYILKSKDAIQKINSICKCIFGAPVVLLICYDEQEAWKSPFVPDYNCGEIDATIVCDHMVMEAWSLGIGSCWVKYFDPADVVRVFSLPENIKPVCLLPIGYPAPGCKPLERMHNVFRPMDEMVTEL